MYRGRIKTLLFIIVFLLVLAVSVTLLLDVVKERREVETLGYDPYAVTPPPTAAPVVTPMPVSTIMPTPVQPTPVLTPPPTPVPTPLPTPTPVPTPPPFVPGQIVGSGTFRSETGVPLNVRAVWTAKTLDQNRVRVTVEVYLESYSLEIVASRNAVNVSVGDSYVSADTPTVSLDNNTQLQTTLIATTEHTLDLASGQVRSFPVQVQYLFRGVYFQRDIDTIECGGAIEIAR